MLCKTQGGINFGNFMCTERALLRGAKSNFLTFANVKKCAFAPFQDGTYSAPHDRFLTLLTKICRLWVLNAPLLKGLKRTLWPWRIGQGENVRFRSFPGGYVQCPSVSISNNTSKFCRLWVLYAQLLNALKTHVLSMANWPRSTWAISHLSERVRTVPGGVVF